MKKLYTKPQMVMVTTEPATLCAASTNAWHVDCEGSHGKPSSSDPDYGEIIYDEGEGSLGENDPFDESNW